jgi:hypothetical protein
MKAVRWLLALALLLAAGGCGGSRLVKATGKVTYQGRPVPSTLVTFQPADGGRPSKGVTDDQGNFTLAYSRDEPGVGRGPHAVFLTYYVGPEEEMGTIKPKASKELKGVIAKYSDPKACLLHFDVTKSGQFFEIPLE